MVAEGFRLSFTRNTAASANEIVPLAGRLVVRFRRAVLSVAAHRLDFSLTPHCISREVRRTMLKLLHISDVLVPFDSQLVDEIAQLAGAEVDYLILCGNFTSSVAMNLTDLVTARDALIRLIKLIVKKENQEARVHFTPGRLDLIGPDSAHSEPDRREQFEEVFGPIVWPYGVVTNVEVRDLKDVTVVCMPYIHPVDSHDLPKQLSAHSQALERRHAERYEYCRHTPTLLVTPESPLLDWNARACLLNGTQLNRVLEKHFCVTLHLFGSAPLFCTSTEPFIFPHVGLSTGPRGLGDDYPIRFNVIYLPGSVDNGLLTVKTFEKRGETHQFQPAVFTPVGPPPLPPPQRSRAYRVAFLQELIRKVITARSSPVLMEYLPGELIDVLDSVDRVPGDPPTAVQFLDFREEDFPIKLDFTPLSQTKGFEQARQRLSNLVALARKLRESVDVIVFVRDRAVGTFRDAGQQREWVGQIVELLTTPLNLANIRWAYATSPTDNQGAWRRLFNGPVIHPPQPTAEIFKTLVKEEEVLLPLCPIVLDQLSGQFTEVCENVIDEVRDAFGSWNGSQQIKHIEIRELFNKSVQGGRPQELIKVFRAVLERLRGGDPVYTALRARCWEQLSVAANPAQAPQCPEITHSELRPRDAHSPHDVDNVVKLLTSHRFLAEANPQTHSPGKIVSDRRYIVRSMVPFLDSDDQPPVEEPDPKTLKLPISGIPIQEVNKSDQLKQEIANGKKIQLFISYARKDKVALEALVRHLNEYDSIAPWWDVRDIPPGKEWDATLRSGLAASRIAVAIVSSHYVNSTFLMEVEDEWIRKSEAAGTIKNYSWFPWSYCGPKRARFEKTQALVHNIEICVSELPRPIREAAFGKIAKWLASEAEKLLDSYKSNLI